MTFRNAWVESVDGGRRRLPGWAAVVVAALVLAAALFGGGALYRSLPAPEANGPAAYLATAFDRLLQDLCIVGPLYLTAFLMIRWWEGRQTPAPSVRPVAATGLGAGAGAGFFLVAVGLAAAFGAVTAGGASIDPGRRFLGVAVGGALILFQAGGEEYFFRGWLQPVLAARWGPWIGLATTSLFFSAAHGVLGRLGAVALVNDFLAGAAFGLLALRTGGLYAAVAAHWGWNWAEQSLVGATPNPGVDPLGALFDLDLKGPSLLSGGADEMNGSLCATAALIGLIVLAAFLRGRPKAV